MERAALTVLTFAVAASAFAGTPQAITFPVIAHRITTGGPLALDATASSGLPVSYSVVSSGNVATLNGNTLTLTGMAGSVSVKVSQAGDPTYDPAPEVHRTFAVGDASQRFVKIASGSRASHALGIRADGSLWAWGWNQDGQLGDGTTTPRHIPVRIGGDTNWASVARGESHTIAVRTDGTLWAWGYNGSGQLGDGNFGYGSYRPTPRRIGAATNWASVACGGGARPSPVGGGHSAAVRADGTLWAWGHNEFGQLGNGSSGFNSISVTPIQIGSDTNWASVACGGGGSYFGSHTVAVRTDGTLWAWGSNGYGQLGGGSRMGRSSPAQVGSDTSWTSVACGAAHTVAVRTDGTLWAWGWNRNGQIGDGNSGPNIFQLSPVRIGSDTNWASLACGDSYTVALRTDGTLWAWGEYRGDLGDGSATNQPRPMRIGSESNWALVACGNGATMAVRIDGTLWAWGSNYFGQLGDGITAQRPSPIGSDSDWAVVACGGGAFHRGYKVTVRTDGTLWAWGDNFYGQLGDGSRTLRTSPVRIGNDTNWATLACSVSDDVGAHTSAVRTDGTLWAWGRNDKGQLGDGTTIDRLSPVRSGSDANWDSAACGDSHTAAVRTDGTLWAWGNNSEGQLGDGTSTDRPSPVQIGSDTNWASVVCGNHHAVAMRTDGALWAWGLNDHGQLGDGSRTQRTSPVPVGNDTNWVSVACGQQHTIAMRTDGTLWGWGWNDHGQLGGGSTIGRTSPMQIGTDTDWTSVACGLNHTVAVRGDGTLWAWGDNLYGQLGDVSVAHQPTPVRIGTGTGWASLPRGLGGRGSAVLALDGRLWTFGSSAYGQLGRIEIFSSNYRTWPERAAQTVTFGPLPGLEVGQQHTLTATSESGLPITYAVVGPATLVGTTLTAIGPGTVTVLAYQTGDTAWLSTNPMRQSLTVTRPALEIAVSGRGSDIAESDTTPNADDDTDFGGVLVAGGPVTRTLTISNSGTAVLDLTGTAPDYVTLSGSSAFSVTTQPSSAAVAADGGTLTFVIAYDPETVGTHTATVSIASDDPDENPFTFVIAGAGRETLSAIELWRLTHFGTTANSGGGADDADPEHDGLVNLIEWACGLDPTTCSVLPASLVRNGSSLEFTYTRSVSAVNAGATFPVEWSDTLLAASWSHGDVTEQLLSDDGTVQVVKATLPGGDGGGRFVRLRIVAPDVIPGA